MPKSYQLSSMTLATLILRNALAFATHPGAPTQITCLTFKELAESTRFFGPAQQGRRIIGGFPALSTPHHNFLRGIDGLRLAAAAEPLRGRAL